MKGDRKKFKAVLISDVHMDYKYTVGADQICNLELCCRAENGFPSENARQAKEWGSYSCDMPPKTVQNAFEFIAEQIKPDLIIWTGDNSP